MRKKVLVSIATLLLVVAAAAYADKRPHEGKIARVDMDGKVLVVQGEEGDQWQLYWTETTKLKGDVLVTELKPGDSIHFDYIEKDGKMWVTELRRTHKAKS
jgi:Cu/Ag efflux protein CusF